MKVNIAHIVEYFESSRPNIYINNRNTKPNFLKNILNIKQDAEERGVSGYNTSKIYIGTSKEAITPETRHWRLTPSTARIITIPKNTTNRNIMHYLNVASQGDNILKSDNPKVIKMRYELTNNTTGKNP